MIRKAGKGARRRRWVLWMLLLVLSFSVALIAYAKWTTSRQQHAIAAAQQEKEARGSQQAAALEEARRTLPPDAGIAQDWSLGEWARGCSPSNINRRPWACAFLLAPTPFSPTLFSEKAFSEIQGLLQVILDNSKANTVYERLDQRTHTPAEVFSALGDLIMAIEDFRPLESALDHGLVVPVPGSNSGEVLYNLKMAADLIAFRAWAEAARGQVDEAIISLRHAFALTRIVADSDEPIIRYPYCHAALRKVIDEAWKHAPMSPEQRTRLVESLPVSEQERLAAFLRSAPAKLAEQKPETMPGVEEFPTPLLRAAISYGYNTYRRLPQTGASERALAFAALVDKRPIDVQPRILALINGTPRYATVTREWMRTAASCDLYVWRCATLPDTVTFVFALKDYHTAHGSYPTSVAEAGGPLPPLPTDPATGKPMEYVSKGKTFSLTFPEASQFPQFHERVGDETTQNMDPPEWRENE